MKGVTVHALFLYGGTLASDLCFLSSFASCHLHWELGEIGGEMKIVLNLSNDEICTVQQI